MRSRLGHTAGLAICLAVFAASMAALLSSETPYGRVAGTVVLSESGTPLRHSTVHLVSSDESLRYTTKTDAEGAFLLRQVPVGKYSVVTETEAHEQPKEKVEVREAETAEPSLRLKPTPPFVRVLQNPRIVATGEEIRLRCLGFAPAEEVRATVYRVAPAVAIRKWHGWLPEALTTGGKPLQEARLEEVPELEAVARQGFSVTARDPEGVFRMDLPLGARPPGTYLISLQAGDVRALDLITVTDLALVVKASPRQAVVYASHIVSGRPVPGARISLVRGETEQPAGSTGPDGLLAVRLPSTQEPGELLVVARAGASAAVCSLYQQQDSPPLKVYTYTDRPIYRPGHTVYYKTLIREVAGDDYRVPSPLQAAVRVVDGSGNEVFSGQAVTGDRGSASGELTLSEEALPGQYTLTLTIAGRPYEATFWVAEYRKPEFTVTVTPESRRVVYGDAAVFEISAQYFYGGPVSGAQVEYTLLRSEAWYSPDWGEWNEDLEEMDQPSSYGGETVRRGKAATDSSGRLRLRLPTLGEGDSGSGGHDWNYSLEAWVTDASKRSEMGSGAVRVTQGDYRLEVGAQDSVASPGEPLVVEVRARDYEDRPAAGAAGEARLAEVRWERGREEVVERQRVPWRADAQGSAEARFRGVRAGSYRITVTAADRRARLISAETWVWVAGEDVAGFSYPYQDLDMEADRKLYRQGDVAEILVNTRHAPQTALLTLESRDVLERRVVRLQGRSTVLRVPITSAMVPGVRASLCFFRNKQFVSGDAVLRVSREQSALRVEVKPDKPVYLPGERVVYQIRTLRADGTPVSAEVSLGVVDEAIYAIMEDDTEPITSFFYPLRVYEVQTSASLPSVYLSGDDKAGSDIETRRRFQDTAHWAPSVVTDESGSATVEVTLPDNLTTWRATCRAATLDSQVGGATAEVVVRKPFVVRLETPRFLTQGDQVTLAAVAQNLTDAPLTATVGVNLSGLTSRDAGNRELALQPGETGRAEWQVTIQGLGAATARVWGRAGRLSDAMELTLPVSPRGRPLVVSRFGEVEGTASMALDVPPDSLEGTRRLTVRLTPTLASSLMGALEYLAEYPYGCVEQTMSSFLPDIYVSRLLRSAGGGPEQLRRDLPRMVEAGLLRLYGLQHPEGHWSWWRHDGPDPWMTAYVVFGLLEARAAGFQVTPSVLESGLRALRATASDPQPKDLDAHAYAAYVLALAGDLESARKAVETVEARRSVPRAAFTPWGEAYQALALARVGRGSEARARVESLLAGGPAVQAADETRGTTWRSPGEREAALLSAALELVPRDPRVADLVRSLARRRWGDHWSSTRETAFALYAIARYLESTSELRPDMTVTVSLDGEVIHQRRLTPEDAFRPEVEVAVDPARLRPGRHRLEVTRSGAGRLYYSAVLEQRVPLDSRHAAPPTPGLALSREYLRVTPGARRGAAASPSGSFASGDVVEVRLTLRLSRPIQYSVVEDLLPAGLEPANRGTVDPGEWSYWWADQVVRDDRVAFAVRRLEPGVHRISYRLRAQTPGRFLAPPPQVYDMYDPSVRSEGAPREIVVR